MRTALTLLLTWSDRGAGGPRPAHHGARPTDDPGPVARLLAQPESRDRYRDIVILCTAAGEGPARGLVAELASTRARFALVPVDVRDPSDYGQIFHALGPVIERLPAAEARDVLLSAGTPQMQTLWVILVQAGLLDARMLQVIPAAFVPSVHPRAVREVVLDIEGFPEIRALRAELVRLRAEARVLAGHLVGDSPPMQALARRLARVAPSDLAVLVCGETGTGKELVARALHEASGRRDGPFIAENCGAFADTVLASELFGHEPGAFTGAARRRRGLFELAHGGTLFLDEIAELSAQAQVTLLRVLQEGTLRRVGGEATTRVDVRVIAATHRDLGALVEAGRFRQDLYYRLRGVRLEVPPLRARVGDLEALVRHFLDQAGRATLAIERAAWDALRAYPWPGNVRELRAEVLRWTVLCDQVVTVADLAVEIRTGAAPARDRAALTPGDDAEFAPAAAPITPAPGPPEPPELPETPSLRPLAEQVAALEQRVIEHALAACGHNLSQTARALAIDRNTLKRKLARYGLGRGRLGD
ncbi:sigma-54 interaction domain-containing protein [Haliangium sp.]|uniref:sigma-54 interaction domain-containing protein n=1 Tax=Haliangium sp. TaxID=2663208 RepID=UPI003D15293A